MKRRTFLACLGSSAIPFFAACNANQSARTVNDAIDAIRGKEAFNPDYPEKLPYASISVSIPGLRTALLILAKVEQDELHWLSADRSVIVTRFGRIAKTFGLRQANLVNTQFINKDFFEGSPPATRETLPLPKQSSRIIDLRPKDRFGIKVDSQLIHQGEKTIQIGSRQHQLTQFEEQGSASVLNWKFSNQYWVDAQNTVWKSTQQIAPESPLITIELRKPYKV